MRNLKYNDAINEALIQVMGRFKNTVCYGLGVPDPKNVFSTTKKLLNLFGPDRVFDTPTSENALTGIAAGIAAKKIKVIFSHQRVDFSLLSIDQLVNTLAKWFFMFGGKVSLPITIRMIIGRGWGQGPTHSQSFQSIFGRIPGLKVVMPSNAYDAKGMLISSILDPNPVIFIEHRWLHSTIDNVPKKFYTCNISNPKKIQNGKDITIVASSYSTHELKSMKNIFDLNNISVDLIDLRVINPLNISLVIKSIKKTGRLLAIDTCHKKCSISSDIISQICQSHMHFLKENPQLLALPDIPTPTSVSLIKNYYPSRKKIFLTICKMLKKKKIIIPEKYFFIKEYDRPDIFQGPF